MDLNWAVALCCATGAVVSDIQERKISNRWLAVCAVAAFTVQAAQGAYLSAAIGGLVGGLALTVPFWLGGIGAGDVKLLAVVGMVLGFPGIVAVLLCTAVAGGVLAVLVRYDVGRARQWLGTPWRVTLRRAAHCSGRGMYAAAAQPVGPPAAVPVDAAQAATALSDAVPPATALSAIVPADAAPAAARPVCASAVAPVSLPYALAVWLGLGGVFALRLAVGA